MEKVKIPKQAIELNSIWIDSLETCLAECGNHDLTRAVMKAAGKQCMKKILEDCEQVLGKKPESVDELLDAMNQRRQKKHNIASLWDKQGNKAKLIIGECNCTLVKAGLAKPNSVHCLCSQGMMERLFSHVCRGQVNVELVKSIGSGNSVCEFHVTFEE